MSDEMIYNPNVKFWMVYVHNGRTPTFIHQTHDSAVKEAERLAQLPENIGLKVFILEVMDYCMVNKPVVWYSTNQPEVPF